MASTIYAVTGRWKSWAPGTATGVELGEYLGEQRLYWGAPAAGRQAYVGFSSVIPPALDAEINYSYALCSLSLCNAEILGAALQSCVLEITLRFLAVDGPTYSFSLNLSLSRDGTTATLALTDDLPLAISVDDLRLSCTGFMADLTAELNATVSSGLAFTVLGTPFEDESCASAEPFFHPDGCDVPAVCPISDDPIIEDCSIPDAIEPIFDCQDIDLPIGSHYGWAGDAGGGGGGGGSGGQGPPGEDGQDACKPRFTVAYEVRWVRYRWEVGVTVETFECPTTTGAPGAQPDCCYQLVFTFYLLTDPLYDLSCCPFLYCGGSWVPQNDELCAGVDPPTAVGEDGQLFYKCDCDATTTTQAPTTTPDPYDWPCHSDNLEWGILICNSNATRDEDRMKVFLNDVDMNVNIEFYTDTCQSTLILDDKFVALDDPTGIDDLIRQLHAVEFGGFGPPCECTAPEIDYGELEYLMSTTGPNMLTLNVPNPSSPMYGSVYLFSFDLDDTGKMRLCCILVKSTYSRPVGNADFDDYSLFYPFLTSGPCLSEAITTPAP